MLGPPFHGCVQGVILGALAAMTAAMGGCQQGNPAQEQATAVRKARIRGLDWLVSHQDPEGSWQARLGKKTGVDYTEGGEHPHVGVTALAGLALLTSPDQDPAHPHQRAARKASTWIRQQASDFGYLSAHGSGMYSHGFATLFLARLQAIEPEQERANTLVIAVGLICSSADEQGAWAYAPFGWNVDLSVTVCQLQALRAARECGTHVPGQAIDKAMAYLRQCRVSSALDEGPPFRRHDDYHRPARIGHFRYDHGEDQRTTFGLNAAGLTAVLPEIGSDLERLRPGLAFLLEEQEALAQEWKDHFFFYYGHYHAAEVMAQVAKAQEDRQSLWLRYWTPISQTLLRNQREEGHWHNLRGPGTAFATAMACLILAKGE